MEIWDLRINTSSSPVCLLTFNMIAESLFQCCVAQDLPSDERDSTGWSELKTAREIPVVLLVFQAIAAAEER